MTCNEVWDGTSSKATAEEQKDDHDFWDEPLVAWKTGCILDEEMPYKATAEGDSTDDDFWNEPLK
jgi:hypothetical protein